MDFSNCVTFPRIYCTKQHYYLAEIMFAKENRASLYRYDSYWYTAPLRVQKLLLFIMQRTSKNFSFVFGIFVVSLKGFSTVNTVCNAIIFSLSFSLKCHLNQNKFTACEHVNILLYGNLFYNFKIIIYALILLSVLIPYRYLAL